MPDDEGDGSAFVTVGASTADGLSSSDALLPTRLSWEKKEIILIGRNHFQY